MIRRAAHRAPPRAPPARREARLGRGLRAAARRSGRFEGTLDEFQRTAVPACGSCARPATRALRRARHVFCPSAYLARLALGWGLDPERVSVLPNPAPRCPTCPRETSRARSSGSTGATLAFAGRLGPQKALDVALEALADVPDVTLVDRRGRAGPRRARAAGARARPRRRVRFLGSVPRDGPCCASSALPTRRCPLVRGRTSRTRSSRRSPSGGP